ncbi:MAG: diguanylate cyclase [Nitrospirae bacterium]|nr:diguanylate cyclase [Nitrospirota bacterium]MCL5421716.1 diguanylate cyclase [Nitrospirota bacterium]
MAKAKILLVEDSKSQAEVTREFLERNGYEVDWVEEGKAAIMKARTQPVDIILLDYVLPDINGNEVCRWLKLNQHTKGIPIIMITTRSSTKDKVSSLEAGADDSLPKPYNEIELNARIYACLRTKALQDELRQKNRQLEEMLERVEILAITDPLTGLFNRRRGENVLEKEFNRTVRYNTSLSCLMVDIDHFKKVNDAYGHRTGDAVLKEVAELVRSNAREIDTVSRWGGEEFLVLLPQTTKENGLRFALRVLKAISHHTFSGISDKQITVSIGLASVPDSSIDSGEKLINASDLALYEAKRKGRNRVESA